MSDNTHIEQEEPNFSAQESLALITSMINKTKDSVAVDSFYFLFWGWLVFAACTGQFILIEAGIAKSYYVWFSMPVGGVISAIYTIRQTKRTTPMTFVDEALSCLWISLGICFFVLIYINVVSKSWQNAFTYYILLYAIGTLTSGQLLKFKPLVIGGIINFILAILCSHFTYQYQLLFGAGAILTSYIIPGHLLRNLYSKKNSKHGRG